jgi:succinyl-diaminopimelate desuccinylase
MVNANHKWVFNLIDERRNWFIKICQELVRITSPNPPGDTTHVAQYIKGLLDEYNIAYKEHLPKANNPILISSIGSGSSPKLNFNSHMDTFPVQDTGQWSINPYSGLVTNGRLYGRGASDMKAGLAAALGCFLMFASERVDLNGTLILSLVSDEENGGRWGTQWIAENIPNELGDACLIGEPTGALSPAIGEKSPLWIRLTTRGDAKHGAYSDGQDAIWEMARIIIAVQSLNDISFPIGGEIAHFVSKFKQNEQTVTGSTDWWLDRPSVNFGIIKGGVKINVSPESAVLELDLRVPFGASAKQILTELDKKLTETGIDVTVEVLLGADESPNCTHWETSFFQIFKLAVISATGQEPQPKLVPYLSDGRIFRTHEVPTILCGPSDHGMGGVDEYISVDEYLKVVRIFAQTAVQFCGIRSIQT